MSAETKRGPGRPPKPVPTIPATAEEIAAAIFRGADKRQADAEGE